MSDLTVLENRPWEQEAKKALAERRRERTLALRACRPHERAYLRQLPRAGYSPYRAGEQLGISSRTVWKLQQRPRIRRVMELFLQDALDEIGVSHASLVADLVEIKDRCMTHLLTEPKAAAGALGAIKELVELLNLTPPKRVELTTRDGSAPSAPIFHISFEDGGPGDYGIEVSDKSGTLINGSDAVN